MKDPNVIVEVVEGVSGICVYLNGYRIVGGKPWGGGRKIYSAETSASDIKTAMSAPHFSKTKGWKR